MNVLTFNLLGHLQQSFKFISILSLYLHYSATLYFFFQTNSPAVLSISLSILFKYIFYSFISFKYYIFLLFFIIISRQITNSHNQILPIHRHHCHHHHHRKSTQSNHHKITTKSISQHKITTQSQIPKFQK